MYHLRSMLQTLFAVRLMCKQPTAMLVSCGQQTWGQLHLNVINYYYYYTIACPITITIILHIKITLLYYYYYYNAINYYYYYSVIFQLILKNINASLKYNYCIRFPMTVSVKRRPSGRNVSSDAKPFNWPRGCWNR